MTRLTKAVGTLGNGWNDYDGGVRLMIMMMVMMMMMMIIIIMLFLDEAILFIITIVIGMQSKGTYTRKHQGGLIYLHREIRL